MRIVLLLKKAFKMSFIVIIEIILHLNYHLVPSAEFLRKKVGVKNFN